MALVFNGTNQYAIHDSVDVETSTAPFSIAATFKTGAVVTGTVQYPIHINRSSSWLRGYGLEISTTGALTVFGSGGSIARSPTILTVQPNTVYRCVIVYDGAGQVFAYVNNISTVQGRSGVSISDTKTRIITGALFDNGYGGYFNGKLARIALYNSAVSAPDITILLNAANTPLNTSETPTDYWIAVGDDDAEIGEATTVRTGATYDADELLPAPPKTITDINPDPLPTGSTGNTVTHTGFTAPITTLTFGGVAQTITGGNTSSTTFNRPAFIAGSTIPDPTVSQNLVISNTVPESAMQSHPSSVPTGSDYVAIAGAPTNNPKLIGAYFTLADLDKLIYDTEGGDFSLNEYGGGSVVTPGARVIWHWRNSDGYLTKLNVTFNGGGEVVDVIWGLSSGQLSGSHLSANFLIAKTL